MRCVKCGARFVKSNFIVKVVDGEVLASPIKHEVFDVNGDSSKLVAVEYLCPVCGARYVKR